MDTLERVLYVEDDPDIREIASLALGDLGGLQVMTCESGQLALASIDEFDPQVVLLDVMMPDMDGPETLEALHKQGSLGAQTAVAFMTAKVHPEELQRYQQIGVGEVISKPFDPMTLAEQVKAIWDRHNA